MEQFIIRLFTAALLVAALSTPALAQNIRADLIGFEETPAVSTQASGQFRGKINKDSSISYTLSYKGLEAPVTQSHIHFGQVGVAGGITVFLCQTATNPDPTGGAPTCPQEGSVNGTVTAANLTNSAAAQGIAGSNTGGTAEEFAELIRAIREEVAYVNVHSTKFPSGEIRGQFR
jgi:hypothetical protein